MHRKKNIVLMSHCILNQNTVVEPLARASGPYYNIVRNIIDKGIGIHQLPCPETRYLGLKREPMSKEEYDTEDFRTLCKSIAEDTIVLIKEYMENGYKILGLIGINHSPTCSIYGRQGIFMEELDKLLRANSIEITSLDVPTDYSDGAKAKDFIEKLDKFIKAPKD